MLSYKKVLKEPSNGDSIKSLKRKVMENKGNKIKIIKNSCHHVLYSKVLKVTTQLLSCTV